MADVIGWFVATLSPIEFARSSSSTDARPGEGGRGVARSSSARQTTAVRRPLALRWSTRGSTTSGDSDQRVDFDLSYDGKGPSACSCRPAGTYTPSAAARGEAVHRPAERQGKCSRRDAGARITPHGAASLNVRGDYPIWRRQPAKVGAFQDRRPVPGLGLRPAAAAGMRITLNVDNVFARMRLLHNNVGYARIDPGRLVALASERF